ncbi:MAG: D-alanyl-D-alanine carboxypeptidase [Lachnospiraceae bacterium]|nr:D-alanyl-D-alanine carboxypeptidase [Lachnospiraceae bacterium]
MLKRITTFTLTFCLCSCLLFANASTILATEETTTPSQNTDSPNLSAASAILMEASTGTIIYEKESATVLPPASITKIMTLLLIFDALDAGQIHLEDNVMVSEYAASMGGSQVFLEAGEVQTVDTMIKCIAVSSANDACVAMSEYISGSEEVFVTKMNERAKGLGMNDTHFVNCNGLDVDGHVTTAKDVALMSRELITKYPEIQNYTTIWMDTIIHSTRRGDSEFGLSSTNKLLKMYEYATGLKTGSTSKAKYCLSATAHKDGIDLIAVIMAAPDHKIRFSEALTLLNYGYGKCRLYRDDNQDTLPPVPVTFGVTDTVGCQYASDFSYLDTKGIDLSKISKSIILKDIHEAPITAGDVAGKAVYSLGGVDIGSVNILYTDSVKKQEFSDCLHKMFLHYAL